MRDIRQLALGRVALTHPSYKNEYPAQADNQRLEFLGDAVIDLIVSEALYHEGINTEGELTRLRASMVCEASFAQLAKALSLDQLLLIGHGVQINDAMLADTLEATIGAMFLEEGYDRTKAYFLKELYPKLLRSTVLDPKTRLQELLQSQGPHSIQYLDRGSEGPAHEAIFVVDLLIDGLAVSTGRGRSKKLAQKQAAASYLSEHESL